MVKEAKSMRVWSSDTGGVAWTANLAEQAT